MTVFTLANSLPASVTALNAICPYFTMFPLTFPLSVLQEARSGDWILDPFCGRGTSLFAARLRGLPTIGIDSHPVAAAVAASKLVAVSPQAIAEELQAMLTTAPGPKEVPQGEFWQMAYHPGVLHDLCRLREALLCNAPTPTRVALRAVILGALHGPRMKNRPSYFSNQSPRTYAPKPAYAVRYWQSRALLPEYVDITEIVVRRASRAYGAAPPASGGLAIEGDSRMPGTWTFLPDDAKVNWIITSPPYYGMSTYRPDQWLRLWFLGGSSAPEYSQHNQISHASPSDFAADLRRVWRSSAAQSTPAAHLIVRFGGIRDRRVDPLGILQASFIDSGWSIERVISAGTAAAGRRQALYFTTTHDPLEEFDVWAVRTP